ncbi:hypothetical protein BBJ28_00023998 [Nothophytophthora sp. Chile5]|nr:hypothetical protein BBJ28_00023998 [Nothophytophthora sp. Chile5]
MKHRKHEELEEMLVAMYDGNMESYQHGEAQLSAPMKLETKVKVKLLQPDLRVQTDDLGQEVIVVDDFEESTVIIDDDEEE